MSKPFHSFTFFSLIQLTKPVITLSVAFSALMGFILSRGSFAHGWLALYSGVLLVAAGSSAINQLQEASHDKLMERTRNRPIPSGRISPSGAALWALLLTISGTLILWELSSPAAAIIALITLFWYNVVYTPLKRVTAFAVIPGALVGALPPAIGWAAAGDYIWHPVIVMVAFFFFMGQIPHFWLIILKHGQDYNKGGYPTLTDVFSPQQIKRLTMTWVLAMAAAALLLTASGVVISQWLAGIIIVSTLLLLFSFRDWISGSKDVKINRAFILLNIYYLIMMLILIADSLIR